MTDTGSTTGGIDDLLAYLDASPSPWHAVASSLERLDAAGYVRLQETEPWHTVAQGYVV